MMCLRNDMPLVRQWGTDPLSQSLTALPAPPWGSLWRYGKVGGLAKSLPPLGKDSPAPGEVAPEVMERADPASRSAAVPGHDSSCENGVQESPQTFLNPEIKNISADYAQSKAEGILNRPAFGIYHAKPHLEKYRSRLPSCHKKGFKLRCAARCHAWMAVY